MYNISGISVTRTGGIRLCKDNATSFSVMYCMWNWIEHVREWRCNADEGKKSLVNPVAAVVVFGETEDLMFMIGTHSWSCTVEAFMEVINTFTWSSQELYSHQFSHDLMKHKIFTKGALSCLSADDKMTGAGRDGGLWWHAIFTWLIRPK